MKSINLKSLVEVYEHNKLTHCHKKGYFDYWGIAIKVVDIETLKNFLFQTQLATLQVDIFNNFFFGYSIPQIGKEFDLLKFTDNCVLNIELKSKYTEKIQKQLIKNKYYLRFLDKKMHLYTYVAEDKTLWKLNSDNHLVQCDIQEIINILEKLANENPVNENPDTIFIPSNYLISPFSKTQEFINGEYFLTKEQEEIEKKIETSINNSGKYFLITGKAGSGKTLLIYSIAKKYMNLGMDVAIIHVGQLNEGHLILCNDFGWRIYAIRNWKTIFTFNPPHMLIIDEVQRMNNKYQFDEIISNIAKNKSILIMSGDRAQTLANNEGWVIDALSAEKFELTGKVRTNKELANFIRVLLDLKRNHHIKVSNQNVDISFFNEFEDAKKYILSKKNYTYISYTPNTGKYSPLCYAHEYNFSEIGNSHQVVGQEFENVITILDNHFYYSEDGILQAYKILYNPYSTLKMFFQQITRAINKLEIVVIENIELYNKIMQIFE